MSSVNGEHHSVVPVHPRQHPPQQAAADDGVEDDNGVDNDNGIEDLRERAQEVSLLPLSDLETTVVLPLGSLSPLSQWRDNGRPIMMMMLMLMMLPTQSMMVLLPQQQQCGTPPPATMASAAAAACWVGHQPQQRPSAGMD